MEHRASTGRGIRLGLGVGALLTAATLCAGPAANAASKYSPQGSITGKVSDSAGDPISGIEVYAYVAGTTQISGETESASNGSYTEPDLAAGSYDLYYFPSTSTGSWLSGWFKNATSEATANPVLVSAHQAAHAHITVQPAATIDGTVTTPAGKPVSGIEVYGYLGTSTVPVSEDETSSDGSYTLPDLASGTYEVQFFPAGAKGSWLGGWYKHAASQATATPIPVTAPNVSEADIRLTRAATIAGTVTDAGGNPVSGINVYAYVAGTTQIAWEAVSATNGSFKEPNLVAGSYDLYYFDLSGAWKSGWYNEVKTEAKATPIAVVPPGRTTVTIVVKPTS